MAKTWTIYALVHPKTFLVHYIGCTSNVRLRRYVHLTGRDYGTGSWVRELAMHGMAPLFEELSATKRMDHASARERLCIRWLKTHGHPLLNKSRGGLPKTIWYENKRKKAWWKELHST